MDNRIKKNLENFKKQIKRQAIQKKKKQLRKQLPYYEQMFASGEESSNGTNSRSSRFPIRTFSSKENSDQMGSKKAKSENLKPIQHSLQEDIERNRQIKYLNYLRDLNSIFSPEDKSFVQRTFLQKYGQNCFSDINLLRDQISNQLIIYESAFIQDQRSFDMLNQMTREDWYFIVASLKIAQNQHFHEIIKSSLFIISTFFNHWYLNKIKKIITEKNTSQTFFQKMKYFQDIEIMIDEMIFSKLIEIYEKSFDIETMEMIVDYFSSKIRTFESSQKQLLRNYHLDEIQSFSEIIFNFGFIYSMEVLAQLTSNPQISADLSLKIFTVVNKYFCQYPINVQSPIQTQEKFSLFITGYSDELIVFMNQFQHLLNGGFVNVNSTQYAFLQSSLIFINSLLWRQLDNYCLYQILAVYESLLKICLTTDGILNQIQNFTGFHIRMLSLYIQLFAVIEGISYFIKQKVYFQYINLLTRYWHQTKNLIRMKKNFQNQYTIKNIPSFFDFQFYLMYALHITEFVLSNDENIITQKQVTTLFQYIRMVYRNQFKILQRLNNQYLQKLGLIFQPNLKLYYEFFINRTRKQIFNPQKQYTPETINKNNYEEQIEI